MQLQVDETIFHNWKIKKIIGEGSFGSVYEIEREEFGRIYKAAAKVISIPKTRSGYMDVLDEGMTEENLTEYYRSLVDDIIGECDLMERMKGDSHIVSYEDHYVEVLEDGMSWTIYIRMELLKPLVACVKENNLTQKDIIQLGIDICRGLETCQKFKVIHRDIKPENIFVSDTHNYKLGDFGISKVMERSEMAVSKKGTQMYMAPEVYRGEQYDATVDIYSLGIVLFRLMNNNRTPFLPPYPTPIRFQDKEAALQKRIMGEPIPNPCNASQEFAEIIGKACSFHAKDRYQRPQDMRRALESILEQESEVDENPLQQELATEDDATLSFLNSNRNLSVAMEEERRKQEKLTEEKRREQERLAEEKQKEQEKLAEEKRKEQEKLEAERRRKEQEAAARKKAEEERRAEEEQLVKQVREKTKEAERLAAEAQQKIEAVEQKAKSSSFALKLPEPEPETKTAPNFEFQNMEPAVLSNIQTSSAGRKAAGGRGWAIIIVLCVAIGGISIMMATAFTKVPELTSISFEDARLTLEDTQLSVGTTEYDFSDSVPAGHVISQGKDAGHRIRKHGSVDLLISKGAPIALMPDMINVGQEDAQNALNELGLDLIVDIQSIYSLSVEGGLVCVQVPEADTELKRGDTVVLYLSLGAGAMPNVTGMTVEEASGILNPLGLVVNITEVFSSKIPAGQIVTQSVAESEAFGYGTEVVLEVSKGTQILIVPSVVGLSESDAVNLLKEAGFTKKKINIVYEYSDRVGKGYVISQSIEENSEVEKGMEIQITVSKGAKAKTTESKKPHRTEEESDWNWEVME